MVYVDSCPSQACEPVLRRHGSDVPVLRWGEQFRPFGTGPADMALLPLTGEVTYVMCCSSGGLAMMEFVWGVVQALEH
jgi:hypothetical protein